MYENSSETVFPPLPRVVRGKPYVLDADPKGEKIIYGCGNSVIIRNIKNPLDNDMYTQHSTQVNVAKYSPSGFYIASADNVGKVRIWDTINKEHILKNEFQPFMGMVSDLAWTSDNERIIVGGNGSSKFGAVFNAETGASVGVIMGMGRAVNSVDFRPIRPYRAIMGNDEGLLCYFEGPPFTFKSSFSNHKGFINVVRYCPNGSFFVSGGSDGKIFLHDGESGDTISEVGKPAHAGGIYGIAFSRDGHFCVSASADKSVKLWKIEGKDLSFISQYTFANDINNMLLSCVWVGNYVAVVSLSGSIHLFDIQPGATSINSPALSIHGHKLHITCAQFSHTHGRLVTASSDGSLAIWDLNSGFSEMLTGTEAHTSQVQSMTLLDNYIVTVGIDDRCVVSSLPERCYVSSMKLPSQPRSICAFKDKMSVVIACVEHVVLLELSSGSLKLLDQIQFTLNTCTMSLSSITGLAIIGCEKHCNVAFSQSSGKLKQLSIVNATPQTPEVVAFSPDGKLIAVAQQNRSINVFTVTYDNGPQDMPTYEPAISEWWIVHSARITCLGWSPNSRRLASGSLDNSIAIWNLDQPKKPLHLVGAHPMSNSTSICWIDEHKLVSTAHDGSIRMWHID